MLKALIEFLTRGRRVISIFDESLEIRAPKGLESIALGNTPADRLAKHSCPFGGCYEIDRASPRKTQ
jgi:hypothetical protein